MSDLIDRGAASRFHLACPFCKTGTVDTSSGESQHTNTHLKWVGITCDNCRRTFTFGAERSTPVEPGFRLSGS